MLGKEVKFLTISKRKKKLVPGDGALMHSNIRLLMTICGKTIAKLSEESQVDELTIKRARTSKLIASCKLEPLYRIAKALNVRLEDLFGFIDSDGEDRCLRAK